MDPIPISVQENPCRCSAGFVENDTMDGDHTYIYIHHTIIFIDPAIIIISIILFLNSKPFLKFKIKSN